MNSATITTQAENCFSKDEAKTWFDEMIGAITADQYKLVCDLASKEEKSFYHTAIYGNDMDMVKKMRELGVRFYVSRMLGDFIKEINQRDLNPVNLAFSYNHDSLLCWAVIQEDDDSCEHGLILSKAKVNAKYCDYGFTLSLTIVSDEDSFSIPSHYIVIKQNN